MSGVFCESKVKTHESMCTWTIHDWQKTKGWSNDMKLRSKKFSSVTNDGTEWSLEIHPMSTTKKLETYSRMYVDVNCVSVYLRLMSVKNKSNVRAEFVLYGLNKTNAKVTLLTEVPETFNINTNPKHGKVHGFTKEFLTGSGLILDGKLKLVCKVTEYTEMADDLGTPKIIVPQCQMPDDYSVLFKTKEFSDVKIIAKVNIELKAHKAILAARSPVFAAMFKHEMTERSKNSIEIMDTDPKVLEEMLRFIYTGKVGDIDKMAQDLLVVADKYDLQRLKIMCEEKLCTTLNAENAADIFMIADRHTCKQLKTLIGSFIREHFKDVIQSEGYISKLESYPLVAGKLLREMSGKAIRDSDDQHPK